MSRTVVSWKKSPHQPSTLYDLSRGCLFALGGACWVKSGEDFSHKDTLRFWCQEIGGFGMLKSMISTTPAEPIDEVVISRPS